MGLEITMRSIYGDIPLTAYLFIRGMLHRYAEEEWPKRRQEYEREHPGVPFWERWMLRIGLEHRMRTRFINNYVECYMHRERHPKVQARLR